MPIIFQLLRAILHSMKKMLLLSLIIVLCFCSCKKEKAPSISSPPLEKTVYLTFDDGPSTVTEDILDVLDQNGIKATFFVVGKCVEKYPEILKRAYNLGHSIGIHSYSHEYKKIYFNNSSLTEDINACQNAIKKIIPEYNGSIFRFAGGSFNLRQDFKDLVLSLGYTYYDWNASTQDAEGVRYSPEQLCENAKKTSLNKNKIILLAHDGAGKNKTAQALPLIIDYYKNAGYTFKSL